MKQSKPNFGRLRSAYDTARFDYPVDVILYVESLCNESNRILDLGCGTGISSRQLSGKGVKVIGCDFDLKMIEAFVFDK